MVKKRRLGYVLAPVLLVFVIILAITLAGMVMMTKARGIMEDMSIAVIFLVLAVISMVFLYLFLKNIAVTKKAWSSLSYEGLLYSISVISHLM